jgi:hypothetical protein
MAGPAGQGYHICSIHMAICSLTLPTVKKRSGRERLSDLQTLNRWLGKARKVLVF